MRVTMLLADAAQAVGGKLYILGGGWSITGPGPVTMAIALKIEVPWDQANREHAWKLALLDQDSNPVTVTTPQGELAVEVSGTFETGRPPGLMRGTPLDTPLTFQIGPLPLPPGGRFVWQLWIDDQTDEDWRVAFTTRRAPAAPTAPQGDPTLG